MDPCIAGQRGRPTSTRRRVPVPVSSLSRGAKLGEERVISWTREHAVGSQIQPAETGGGPPPVKTGVRAPTNPPLRSVRPRARARARSSERQEKDGAAFRARLEKKEAAEGGISVLLSTCTRHAA